MKILRICFFFGLLLFGVVVHTPLLGTGQAASALGQRSVFLPLINRAPEEQDLSRHVGVSIIQRDFQSDIFVFRPDGSELRQLTQNGGIGEYAWSPDGTEIVFTTSSDGVLYLVNFDGSNLRPITTVVGWNRALSWSPDGTQILFDNVRDSTYQYYVVPHDGGAEYPIGAPRTTDDGGGMAWSPDSSTIAYTRAVITSSGSIPQVFTVHRDGTNDQQVTSNEAGVRFLAWIEGGDAFVAAEGTFFEWDIYRYDADGASRRGLATAPGPSIFYGVSPTLDQIVYAELIGSDETYSLFIQDTGSTERTLLLERKLPAAGISSAVGSLAWSPQERTLAIHIFVRYAPSPNATDVLLFVVPLLPEVEAPTDAITMSLYAPYWVGGERYLIAQFTDYADTPPREPFTSTVLFDTVTRAETTLQAVPGDLWLETEWRYFPTGTP